MGKNCVLSEDQRWKVPKYFILCYLLSIIFDANIGNFLPPIFFNPNPALLKVKYATFLPAY